MMNSLRVTLLRNTTIKSSTVSTTFTKRYISSHMGTIPKPPVPECYLQHNFRTDFLSDPSTYPLIVVMGFTTLLIIGMSTNTIVNDNHDIRIFPHHKQDVLRTWGDDKVYDKVTRRLALGPIIMHEKDYRTIWQEGLGVNHEEWLKRKQQQQQASNK